MWNRIAHSLVPWLVLLLVLFLLTGVCGYGAYLAAHEVPEIEGPASLQPPPARRVVLVVIDAFHPARAFDLAVMPNFVRLAAEGASGIVRTGPVSTTAPCVFDLMTGRPGDLVQAVLNFDAREVRGPSLPRSVVRAGRRIALSGDKTWVQQFGWLARPEDRHVSPEPGITLDARLADFDREAVEFLIARMDDPGIGLLIVHVDSTDAIGHMVTPYGERYIEQLRFVDGLVGQVAQAAEKGDTVLLVTGDHGMGAKGSHGGAEEEARLTPYVLRGPGVKVGEVRDIPQSAVAPTLAALLGLPLPVASQYPPLTELLALSPADAGRLRAAYFHGKLAAARIVSTDLLPSAQSVRNEKDLNERLNVALFGGGNPPWRARVLTAWVTALGVLVALAMCRAAAPRLSRRWGSEIATAALPLVAFGTAGRLFLEPVVGQNVPYKLLASGLGTWTLVTMGASGCLLLSSPQFRQVLGVPWPALFFAGAVVASAPLLGSAFRSPAGYFELLLLAMTAVLAFVWRRRIARWAPSLVVAPAVLAGLHYAPGSGGAIPQWAYLSPLSAVIVGLAYWNLRSAGQLRGTLGCASLCLAFGAAWLWRAHPVPPLAAVVLATSLVSIAAAPFMREPLAAATLTIAGSASLFLMMADFGREALVFLAAASAALVAARGRLDFSRLRILYSAAAFAILLRLCLFFQLGDEYMVNSIRTAAGFRLVDFGLPLAMVISLLILKYTLSWLVILAAGLRSLAWGGREVTRYAMGLIALGYVARLALVAAAADPLRRITDGVRSLVSVFCISWVEFGTFAIAATFVMAVLWRTRSGSAPGLDSAGT